MRDWPETPADLARAQVDIAAASARALRQERWRPGPGRLAVAGCFVCFDAAGGSGERGWAAAAVVEGRRVRAVATVATASCARYEPGLLALREGRALEDAVRALDAPPAVLLVNATGMDHPRRAGLALHLGAVLGLPTVGVTDRPLLASGAWPGEARGARSPLRIDDEVVACWLRSREGARPVAVHPGWRTDLDAAVTVVLGSTRGARTPEPLRRARAAARSARSAASDGTG